MCLGDAYMCWGLGPSVRVNEEGEGGPAVVGGIYASACEWAGLGEA